jgi:hypothetical protein
MRAILANLLAARRNRVVASVFVAISFDAGVYARSGLTLTAMQAARDFLLSAGLAEGQRGYRRRESGGRLTWTAHARRTRLRATDVLVQWFGDAGVDLRASTQDPASALGWRKDRQTVVLTEPVGEPGAEPDTVRESREVLASVNKLNNDAVIDLPASAWARVRSRLPMADRDTVLEWLTAGDGGGVFLRRKFKYSWDDGGRLYGGWWQTLPKEERPHLLINGRATVELDYGRLHPTLIYAERGLALDFDPYQVPGYDGRLLRELGKYALNSLLNRDRQSGPPSTLKAKPEHRAALGADFDFQRFVSALTAMHAPIVDAFGTGIGLRLQRIDSDILVKVLRRTSREGIVALPIHDSVIVDHRHEVLLRSAMIDAYKEVTGQPAGPISSRLGDLEVGVGEETVVVCTVSTPSDTPGGTCLHNS